MSTYGTPSKVFSTPQKSVTAVQLASLREKVVKESPALYKNKVLSSPLGSVGLQQPSAFGRSGTPALSPAVPQTATIPAANAAATETVSPLDHAEDSDLYQQQMRLGKFENPVLDSFSSRIVNKELESRRIIYNAIGLLVWNLALKYYQLFLYRTDTGGYIMHRIESFCTRHATVRIGPQINLNTTEWLAYVTLDNVSHLLRLVMLFNIVVSLWKLLIKAQSIKIDDLHLNQKQKQLLGLIDTPSNSKILPRVMLSSSESRPVPELLEVKKPPAHPFLFKSLRTPLKARNSLVNNDKQSASAFVDKVNAFGNLQRASDAQTSTPVPVTSAATVPVTAPVNRSGYIPSSKYLYMMDSPSPRKRM
ncbi:LAMI_0H08812g1_1 [Lachancea mirantina]|uniref:LAMI_0H08812g1_1 n=1 Tax=Lachancea mirantina TaxID=1230905 RepID=A0A1G4KG89_9SACH|nr:LAMI_0H08812g1_1 [Lachancea mirantina]